MVVLRQATACSVGDSSAANHMVSNGLSNNSSFRLLVVPLGCNYGKQNAR
jgi:hypothetical protein